MGTESNANPRLVSVCSEYKYWNALVAHLEPAQRAHLTDSDIATAEILPVRALEQATVDTPIASWVKNKMIHLDPAFDERTYGCRTFRDFLARLQHRISIASTTKGDITIALAHDTNARADEARPGSPTAIPPSR